MPLVLPHRYLCAVLAAAALWGAALVARAQQAGPPKPDGTPHHTLEQCVSLALRNSAALAAQREKLVALEEDLRATIWKPFSQFRFQASGSMVPDKCAVLRDGLLQGCDDDTIAPDDAIRDSWGPSIHLKLRGALPIPTSNALWKGKKALEERNAAYADLARSLEDTIRYNVHQAYHAVIGAREMLYTLSQGRKFLTKAQKKVEENLANQEGTETQIDLVKLQVFALQLDAWEQEAKRIEEVGLAALRFLTGAQGDDSFDVDDTPQTLVDDDVGSLEDYVDAALHYRPELSAMRHKIRALDATVSLRKTAMLPTAHVAFEMRLGWTPGVQFTQETNGRRSDDVPFVLEDSYNYNSFASPVVALVVSYPLDFGVDVHRLRQAKAELRAAVLEERNAIESVVLDVRTAYAQVTRTAQAIAALERAKRLARGWVTAASQNLATGVGGSKDVKDALKEYFQIMTTIHQKIADYNIGVANLHRAAGNPPRQSE